VPAAVTKSLGEINFVINLDERSVPFRSTLWLELDRFDRISAVCIHCHRPVFIPVETMRHNDLMRCEWCKQEQQAWDALFEARPDILQSALTVPIEEIKNELVSKLEQMFQGSGLKITRR
jgi:hypothetical protein